MEMTWLDEHGVIGSYADYENLPPRVLDDARMVMRAEIQREQRRRAVSRSGR